jgi:excisionase family DNA binding protein
MNKNMEHLWTIDDMADFCSVKPSVVKYWVHNNAVPFIKLGKQIRFNPEDIRNWVLDKHNHRNMSIFGLEKVI